MGNGYRVLPETEGPPAFGKEERLNPLRRPSPF